MEIPRVDFPPQDRRDGHSSAAKARWGPGAYICVQSPAFSKAAAAWMTEASS